VSDDPNEAALAAAGIRPLPLPTPFAIGRVNAYLVDDDPLTLVDAGPNSSVALADLEERLAVLGRRLEDVGLLLVTHQHYDHAGLAALVRERSGCEVAALRPLASLLGNYDRSVGADDAYQAELMNHHGVPEETVSTLEDVSRAFRRFGSGVVVDRPLEPGDEIRLAGRRLVVHHRPGHSPTDTLFVDPEARVAFVGDHLLRRVSPNPVIHSQWGLHPRRSALLAYLDSLERTAELDLDLVLPGHGESFGDHRDLIASRLGFHRERAEEFAGLLGDGPSTAHELSRAKWGDVALRQAFLTLCEVLGHMDLLESQGRVVAEADSGALIAYRASS
jgi:glyoxylase-like metal-dependent hydrolase (beta-lactamase superfamily II)